MKNKGYPKFGGGGGQISSFMGDMQVAYLIFVSRVKGSPSLVRKRRPKVARQASSGRRVSPPATRDMSFLL